MSAMKTVLAKLHEIADELVAEEHKLGARLKEIVAALAGDEPKLIAEAESDAADVVHTAQTQGLVPAEREAVADGTTLIEDTGHDLAAAIEGSGKAAASEATASAEPTA